MCTVCLIIEYQDVYIIILCLKLNRNATVRVGFNLLKVWTYPNIIGICVILTCIWKASMFVNYEVDSVAISQSDVSLF